MPRVICSLPHAASVINGVPFTLDRGEMISDEVSDVVANNFALIPGYRVVGQEPEPPLEPVPDDGEPPALPPVDPLPPAPQPPAPAADPLPPLTPPASTLVLAGAKKKV